MATAVTFKSSVTIKEYKLLFYGGSNHKSLAVDITIPVGAVVSNKTACGYDDSYRFWRPTMADREAIGPAAWFDVVHRGINIPEEYCKPYRKD